MPLASRAAASAAAIPATSPGSVPCAACPNRQNRKRVFRTISQRHPHAEFVGPLAHGVAHHTVKPDRR